MKNNGKQKAFYEAFLIKFGTNKFYKGVFELHNYLVVITA